MRGSVIRLLPALLAAALLLALCPPAAQAADYALDKLVAGKPVLKRQVPIRIDVVGYDVKRNPGARSQLQAVAQAGGGSFSSAGVKDISKIMTGVVTGGKKPTPPPRGRRLIYGETIIRHGGRLQR